MNAIKKIFNGYSNLFIKCNKTLTGIIKVLIFLVFVFALSILVVYPLWYLADKSPELYSDFVEISVLVIVLTYIVLKIISIIRNEGVSFLIKEKVLPVFKKLVSFLLVGFSILVIAFIFTSSIIIGSVLVLLLLVILGYVKFVYKS